MAEPPNRDLAALREAWPAWEVWTVRPFGGGTRWCAKRRDGTGGTLQAWEPGHLAEYMAAETGQ